VNELMDAEADQMCGEGNSRNGYRERKLLACVGALTLRVPSSGRGASSPRTC
jgi:transposase-like protein